MSRLHALNILFATVAHLKTKDGSLKIETKVLVSIFKLSFLVFKRTEFVLK